MSIRDVMETPAIIARRIVSAWIDPKPYKLQPNDEQELQAKIAYCLQRAVLRCAELVKGGAEIQRMHAANTKRENRWNAKEMSVSESGVEAYLTAANALEFWEYQIRHEFGLLSAIPWPRSADFVRGVILEKEVTEAEEAVARRCAEIADEFRYEGKPTSAIGEAIRREYGLWMRDDPSSDAPASAPAAE